MTTAPPQSPPGRVTIPTPGATAARNRRRPMLIVLGVMLIATSALAAAFAFSQITTSVAVVGVARDVAAGQALTRADLTVMQVNEGSGLDTVAADRLDAMVGLRATRDLGAGTTLTPTAVADTLVPTRGRAVIGVVAAPGTAPVAGIGPGTVVSLIELADDQPEADGGEASPAEGAVNGRVVAVEPLPDGTGTRVDIEVDAADAERLQRLAAAQRLGVVIVSQER